MEQTEVKDEELKLDSEEKKDDKKNHKVIKDKSKEKIKELENIIKAKDLEISNLKNDVLKEKAELINFRKRKEEETSRMLKYSNESIVKEILPILDNFERAIDSSANNMDEEMIKYFEGIKMIYCHLNTALSKFDVIPIDGSNKPFDPVYHQALMLEKKEGIEPGMVLDVLQKGYLLKDRVIRPAMVKVSE